MTQRVMRNNAIHFKIPIINTNDLMSFQEKIPPLEKQISKIETHLTTEKVKKQPLKVTDQSPLSTNRVSFNVQLNEQIKNEFQKKTSNLNQKKRSLEKKFTIITTNKFDRNVKNKMSKTLNRNSKTNTFTNINKETQQATEITVQKGQQKKNNLRLFTKQLTLNNRATIFNSPSRNSVKRQSSLNNFQESGKQNFRKSDSCQIKKFHSPRFQSNQKQLFQEKRRNSSNENIFGKESMDYKQMSLLRSSLYNKQSNLAFQVKKDTKTISQEYTNSSNIAFDIVREVDLETITQQAKTFKEYSFPLNVIILIIQYNMDELPKLQRISASWYLVINDAIDDYLNKVENSFVKKYSEAFNFVKSYNSITPLTFCNQKGIRIDRIFQCEILDNLSILNQTMMIAYDFGYIKLQNDRQKDQRYATEYRFDIIKKNKQRVTWIHLSDELPPYSQNEIQMSPGDIIEFAVCIYNMNGIVNLDSFNWEDAQLFKISKNERDPLIYNRDIKILTHRGDRRIKVHCNINRICEVEDAVPEWLTIGKDLRDTPKISINTNIYENRFNVLSVQFNELDQHYNKIVLQAKRRGVVEQNIFGENMQVHVKAEEEQICNEIKKRGVMFDRNKGKEKIQLRVNDILVIYNSIKIPEELQPIIVFPVSSYQSKVTSNYNTQTTSGGMNSENKNETQQ